MCREDNTYNLKVLEPEKYQVRPEAVHLEGAALGRPIPLVIIAQPRFGIDGERGLEVDPSGAWSTWVRD